MSSVPHTVETLDELYRNLHEVVEMLLAQHRVLKVRSLDVS